MPRTTQLTQEEVFAAIGDLLSYGEYPTSARLREELGGRGSPVVLQRFLSSWYGKFGPSLAESAAAARPAAVGADLRAQLEAATKQALADFDRQHADRLASLEDREARTKAFGESLEQRAAALDDRETTLQKLIDRLTAEAAEANASRDAAVLAQGNALGALQAERDAHQRTAAALTVAQAEAVDAVKLQAALAQARLTSDREAARVVELAKERDEANARAKAARVDATQLREQLDEVRSAHESTRLELATSRALLAAAEKTAEQANTRLEAQRAMAEAAQAALLAQIDQLHGRMDALAEAGATSSGSVLGLLEQVQAQLAAYGKPAADAGHHPASLDTPPPARDSKRRSRRDTAKASSVQPEARDAE